MSEEHTFQMVENKVFAKISGPKRGEAGGGFETSSGFLRQDSAVSYRLIFQTGF
jgi:hypothetical protein